LRVYEGNITFSDVTSHGIRVEFGKPWSFVSWREAQYVCCWDIEGVWFTSEWFETMGTKSEYDYEPISDKQCRHTNARVLEAGPARTVIHWRYSLCDTLGRIFNGNTAADEYHYIYPDGISVRKLVGWPGDQSDFGGDPTFWEVGEVIIVNPKGSMSYENINPKAATFSDAKGQEFTLDWTEDEIDRSVAGLEILSRHRETWPKSREGWQRSMCLAHPKTTKWDEYIIRVNLRNRPSPFVIFPRDNELFPHAPCSAGCEDNDHPHISLWPSYQTFYHWPIFRREYQIGFNAAEPEMMRKATHTSVASIGVWQKRGEEIWRPKRGATWLFLTGVTTASNVFLRELAKSWLHPAEIHDNEAYQGYDPSQRAYLFKSTKEKCEFTFEPTNTIINPVFILDGWKGMHIKIKVNDQELSPNEFEYSWQEDKIIVWTAIAVRKTTTINFTSE